MLIDDIHRFVRENGRNPTKRDMNNKNGYISQNAYYSYFGSWDVALQAAGLRLNRGYTNKEFLINELKRFYEIYGKSPTSDDMGKHGGFPSMRGYRDYFNSWNDALEAAGLNLNMTNEKRTGLETCCVCGDYKKENQRWITKGLPKGQVMCTRCYKKYNSLYMNGSLSVNSDLGFALVSEKVVAKTLGLNEKQECNISVKFTYKYDLYDNDKYYDINVKASHLLKHNAWVFTFKNKYTPSTYILVGFDENRKNILHVWITDPLDDLTYDKVTISITNSERGLKRAKPWEVDAKPYNDSYHSTSLDNCKYLSRD